jgi:hypothetical protein
MELTHLAQGLGLRALGQKINGTTVMIPEPKTVVRDPTYTYN